MGRRIHPSWRALALVVPFFPHAVGQAAPANVRYTERAALRADHPLTWAECLRQRASESPALAQHRVFLLAHRPEAGPLADDVQYAARLLRDAALDARTADDVNAVVDALRDTLGTPDVLGMPARPALFDEAWLAAGLRAFDIGAEMRFITAVQDTVEKQPTSVTTLATVLLDPATDLPRNAEGLSAESAKLTARLAVELRAFVAYAAWTINLQVDPAWVVEADVADQPTAAKLAVARLLAQQDKPPIDAATLTNLRKIFAERACPRWDLELAILAQPDNQPLAKLDAPAESLIKAKLVLYATRAHLLPTLPGLERAEHRWWPVQPKQPVWYESRLNKEAEIDKALDDGRLEDAFKLVQEAKCLPLLVGDETVRVDPAAVADFDARFQFAQFRFQQHAFLEYYWGANRQGVFFLTNRFENGIAWGGHSELGFAPLADAKQLENGVLTALTDCLAGKDVQDRSLCQKLFPEQVKAFNFGAQAPPKPIYEIDPAQLDLMVAPDGPLWALPFEALPTPAGPLLGSMKKAPGAMFSYTPTAAALKAKIPSKRWFDCWQANVQRALAAADLTLPGDQGWIVRNPENFPLVLTPFPDAATGQIAAAFRGPKPDYTALLNLRQQLPVADVMKWSLVYVEAGARQ